MVSVSFLYPNFLWLLVLVPVFIFIYFFSLTYGKKKAFVFSNFQALQRFYGVEFFSRNFLVLYMNLFVVVFLILGVSGMQLHYEGETAQHSYVLLIDNSGSMSTTDISPSRFRVAKDSATTFIDNLPFGTSVGVIGFSGEAIVYQDLTTDKIKAKSGVENIAFGTVEGTNIYNAVLAADKLFDTAGRENPRSVIIISDGQINVGEAPQIISYAERNQITMNTMGIGTVEGGLGQFDTIMKADIDFLKSLAFNSGGSFFQINSSSDLDNSFDLLITVVDDEISIDIAAYLILVAILLFTINWFLVNFRFRTFP